MKKKKTHSYTAQLAARRTKVKHGVLKVNLKRRDIFSLIGLLHVIRALRRLPQATRQKTPTTTKKEKEKTPCSVSTEKKDQ